MNWMKKFPLIVLGMLAFIGKAQEDRVITTAVPFLTIAADARAAPHGSPLSCCC